MDATNLPPVEAEIRTSGDLSLTVDPIALAALRTAQAAGVDQAAQLGQLPDADDLPLAVMVLEARCDAIESRLLYIEQWVQTERVRD